MSGRIRVLLVDDSAFARKVVRDVLAAESDIEVVGIARDGLEALEKIQHLKPDVVTLDLMMPELDGVGLLHAIADWPDRPHAVVVTTLDDASEAGLAALVAGAFDLVQKPTPIASDRLYEIRPALVAAIRAAGAAPRGARKRADVAPVIVADATRVAFDLVVIGASTGGPQAIASLLGALPANFPVPIGVVVHLPPGYTAGYAARLDRDSALDVFEAREELELTPGRVAIARAGMHLTLAMHRGTCRTHLSSSPIDTLHKPSVDVLFASAAAARGPRVLGVVLTGMGDDGVLGSRAIRAQGGRIIAEAESTCVVFGMPRAVIDDGLASEVVPLDGIAAAIAAAVTPG
ncbi:MAG TPA: chemotaxis-specific protein-glutamate methyltransferase CheB [Polyangiaceae bacterium]|nr:chemotaxis-specific protein-glutamate methyltransferase CheB [Polyangiaceae bacterium]